VETDFYNRPPKKDHTDFYGRSSKILGALAKLWALYCRTVCLRGQSFAQANAHKTTKVPFGALDQKFGRSTKTMGAQLADSFHACSKLFTTERPKIIISSQMGS
jgi:hypothetical protein